MIVNKIEKNNCFSKAVFHGFVLKKSFWYGYMDGKPIAFCEKPDKNGNIKIYVKENEDALWKAYLMATEKLVKLFPEFAQ